MVKNNGAEKVAWSSDLYGVWIRSKKLTFTIANTSREHGEFGF
jgi:hypothetical protein